jgi:hypothetical protein
MNAYMHINAVVMRLENEREREIEKDSQISPLEIRCFTDSIMMFDRIKKKKNEK